MCLAEGMPNKSNRKEDDMAKTGGAGSKKYGRNKDKCASYRTRKLREMHKIRRVLKASGREEALRYATKHGLVEYLNKIAPQPSE